MIAPGPPDPNGLHPLVALLLFLLLPQALAMIGGGLAAALARDGRLASFAAPLVCLVIGLGLNFAVAYAVRRWNSDAYVDLGPFAPGLSPLMTASYSSIFCTPVACLFIGVVAAVFISKRKKGENQ